MTAPPGSGARARRRAPVEDVTVLVLTRPGGPLIDPLLDSLAAQTRRPTRVVLTGLDPDEDEVARARSHPLTRTHGVHLVVAAHPAAGPRGDDAGASPPWSTVIDRALADLAVGPGTWVWVLPDDSAPEPSALERLVAVARQSSAVGAVGPKLVDAEQPRRLVGVGLTATRAGRPTGEEAPGLVDQGQLDRRRDVLGVPLTGLLVRAEVLGEVGGMDPVGDGGAEGLDLSWRCHLAGHRVLVAPAAVVRQGPGGRPSRWRRRVATRHVALAREAWWRVPFRALGVLLTSLLAALALLLVKRPREAALEWADVVAVLSPWRRRGARWRFRGRRRVRRRDLQTLFDRPGVGWRSTLDTLQDALTPRTGRSAAARATTSRETGPVEEDARSLEAPDRHRWSAVPWLLLAVVTAVAVVRWREHWGALAGGGRGLAGPELPGTLGVTTSSATWRALRDAWHGPGLGTDAPGEPWLLPLTALAWFAEQMPGTGDGAPGAVAVAWFLLLAPSLSAVAAYLAARCVLRARVPRLALGLVWAGLPPVTAAVGEARVGPALAVVVLPLVVVAFAVSARAGDGARRTAASFAGALGLAVAGLGVPGLLVLGSLAGLALFVLGPGWGRLRGLVLAVLPWLLQGPWLAQVWQDPRLVLGGPGATTTAGAVPPWQALLLHAGGPQPLSLWWTAPLLLVAVLGPLRRGAVGRRTALFATGWLLGLAAALAAPLLALGQVPEGYSDVGASVTAWPGSYLAVSAACALLAGGAALAPPSSAAGRAGSRWERRWSAARRPATAVLAGVAGAAGLGLLAWATWTGLPGLAVASVPAPAVVTEQARAGEAMRMLELRRDGDTVSYRLHGREVDGGARDRVRELSPVTAPDSGAGGRQLVDAVGALTGDPRGAEAPEARTLLHDLAVGYVGLQGGASDEQGRTRPLAEELDAVPGLTRLSRSEDLVLWRVGALGGESAGEPVPVSRARLLVPGDGEEDQQGPVASAGIPATGDHARLEHTLERPVEGPVWLQVSEGEGWAEHAEVRADGEVLQAGEGPWPPTYRLPEGAERLDVEVSTTHDRWWLATAVLAGLTLFLALPLGAGRRRKELAP